MFCAISGNAPEVPVVSKKTGHCYEKSMLQKYVDAEGKCPMTGEEMTMDDAVEVQANKAVRPRPITATSIPGMLTLFQDEWDTLMLETHELRQHSETLRQELAKTLYQHDAACRVIARLVTERDEARAMLSQMQAAAAAAPPAAAASGGGAASMQVEEEGGITEAIKSEMVAKFDELQAARKPKAKMKYDDFTAAGLCADLGSFAEQSSNPLHGSGKTSGIACMVLDPKNPAQVLSGGNDGSVVLFDTKSAKIVFTHKAHKKPITDVQAHPSANILFTTSMDKSAQMYVGSDSTFSGAKPVSIKSHKAAVVGCAIHPTGNYVVTASMDSTWELHDLSAGSPRMLSSISDSNVSTGFSAVGFHPDGIYLGTGSAAGLVQVFDIRTQKAIANCTDHKGAVNSISFSENGFYLATGADDGSAIVWDLRKLKNTASWQTKAPVSKVQFDYTGMYLAIASDVVDVYKFQKEKKKVTWESVAKFDGHKGAVTSVAFGPNAQSIVTSGADRTVKVWGA